MKIVAFSKYLAYKIGGAEASTRQLLSDRSVRFRDTISIVSQANAKFIGSQLSREVVPADWTTALINFGVQLSRFSHVEYCLNRLHVESYFSKLRADELWTYGSLAPAAILGFGGSSRYFIRSETDLGIVGNYHSGANRFFKSLYTTVEYPATYIYRRDLQLAIQRSIVVANSKYMAARAHELFGVEAEVLYPPVDITSIRQKLESAFYEKKWVVFVGDSPVKGIKHVLMAAKLLPEVNFRIISRFVDHPRQEGNVLWSPWESQAWRIYSSAHLVIVPSQWEEAYGRVAREAYLLGIPVLVSNVGGLPEAVDQDHNCLVDDFRNPDAWVRSIRNAVSLQQDLELSQ